MSRTTSYLGRRVSFRSVLVGLESLVCNRTWLSVHLFVVLPRQRKSCSPLFIAKWGTSGNFTFQKEGEHNVIKIKIKLKEKNDLVTWSLLSFVLNEHCVWRFPPQNLGRTTSRPSSWHPSLFGRSLIQIWYFHVFLQTLRRNARNNVNNSAFCQRCIYGFRNKQRIFPSVKGKMVLTGP